MSTSNVTPKRVVLLAAVESATASDHVLAAAKTLASSIEGAELHLLHVVDVPPRDDGNLPGAAKALDNARDLLESLGGMLEPGFRGRIVGHLAAGTAWREIVQLATNLRADYVIVGTADKKGMERLLLGSVAEQVAKKAPCAVLVARRKDTSTDVPEILPPCEDCVATQRETAGAKLWCTRHATRHPQAHLHYETPASFGLGSMLLRT